MQQLLLTLMTALATTSFGWSEIKMEGAKATLEKGNQRFTEGTALAHNWQRGMVAKTGNLGQTPSVAVLTCAEF